MPVVFRRGLDLVPIALLAVLVASWSIQCGDDEAQNPPNDAGVDAIGDPQDALGDPGEGDPDLADLASDLADADVITPTCFAERRERPVGGVCAPDNDRICLEHTDCRDTERCEWRDEGDEFGTCIYQIPEPIACPGGPSCPEVVGAPLLAGFAVRTITPLGWELPREESMSGRHFEGDPEDPDTFWDCGRDMICPGDPDYPGPDPDGSEGDGRMQGIWMAGLNMSVPALPCPPDLLGEDCTGPDCCAHELAHDDIWARGVIFAQGESKVALVSLDLIGFFYSDVQDIVAELPETLDLDLLIVASTHAHEGPDTMGLWGPGFGGSSLPVETGIDPEHIAYIRRQVVEVLEEADAALEAVDVYATSVQTGVREVAGRDSRDPFIFNDHMPLMQVVRAGGDPTNADDTVGVLVSWGNHPEAVGSNNHHISSDYPHYLRTYLEEGLPAVENGEVALPALSGLGGPAIFFAGTLGGLTTPLRTSATARDGTVVSESGFAKAEAIGQQLAQQALEALAEAPQVDGDLRFGMREFMLGVPNLRFHIAIFSLNLFPEREIYNWRFSDGFGEEHPPQLLTSVARLQIGPVSLATVPGEMFPETVVGGFREGDSDASPVRGNPNDLRCAEDLLPPDEGAGEGENSHPCLINPDNPNPPDLSAAPTSGFVQDVLPGEVHFIINNGMDAVGYFVPEYDFEVSEAAPYVSEPPGHHYEETNSVGPVLRQVLDELEALWDVSGLFQ